MREVTNENIGRVCVRVAFKEFAEAEITINRRYWPLERRGEETHFEKGYPTRRTDSTQERGGWLQWVAARFPRRSIGRRGVIGNQLRSLQVMNVEIRYRQTGMIAPALSTERGWKRTMRVSKNYVNLQPGMPVKGKPSRYLVS